MASGLALKALLVGPNYQATSPAFAILQSHTFWATTTFIGVAMILFGPRIVYRSVEHTIKILVVLITLELIIVTIKISTVDTWKQLGAGLVNLGYIDQAMLKSPDYGFKRFFIAIVFAGAGGTANLFYSFYLCDKHIGMGGRIPSMAKPLRGRGQKIPATGFNFSDTDANQRRFQSWWKYVRQDQTIFFSHSIH